MLIAILVITLLTPGLIFLFVIVIQALRGKADPKPNNSSDHSSE